MASSSYQAKDIEVLEGLEAVRRRPSMYIGGVDARGLHHLLWEIVDNSVDEFLAGHANSIDVTLHKDLSSLTISDNGRGIPVDMHPKYKKSALEIILCTLHAGGKFSDKNYARSGGLHGVGSSVVNALSTEMRANVYRDGFEWAQTYHRGVPAGPVKKLRPFRGHGTTIFFRPDDDIFRRTLFSADTIRQHLEDIAYIHAGLQIKFSDEDKKETVTFHQPAGISAYLDKLMVEEKRKAVHETAFVASRDEKDAKVEVVLKWTESTDEQCRSYVNGIRTHAGGTHVNGLRSGLAKALRNYMDVHDIKPKGVTISTDDMREGTLAILSVFLGDPMFQGQTKERLNNPETANTVESLVRPALEQWLNANPSVADAIIGRVILAARARAASRDAAAEVRRKTPGSRKLNLPAALMDCQSHHLDDSELFLVEGISAAGTAGMARNPKFQSVLPLRGKVLNTETLTTAKALDNQEINDLVQTLGTGIGNDFDINRLRYGKIVLLMDADSDGYHITTLLLTFFFRHMRELIRQQRLFIAMPPLYRLIVGKESIYAHDDAHKEAILASLPANRNVEIGRFKGLGEMDAEQLRETTLDPRKRTLLKVEIESQVEAEGVFHQLMGKDASERYRIIMAEASFADDLDV